MAKLSLQEELHLLIVKDLGNFYCDFKIPGRFSYDEINKTIKFYEECGYLVCYDRNTKYLRLIWHINKSLREELRKEFLNLVSL